MAGPATCWCRRKTSCGCEAATPGKPKRRCHRWPSPKTIYDFYGFPEPLYATQYPAPGAPDVARLAQDTVRKTQVALGFDWGLDHGAWSVLCRMFPQADVPVVQLSLDRTQEQAHYYELGQAARPAVPTNEHHLPLLYVLALQDKRDEVRFFADKVTMGSMSMRSVRVG
jgi:aromatic ring-opening dioxygenase catalytic subunit (LigB family)